MTRARGLVARLSKLGAGTSTGAEYQSHLRHFASNKLKVDRYTCRLPLQDLERIVRERASRALLSLQRADSQGPRPEAASLNPDGADEAFLNPDVPQIDGYQMPAMLQNAEDNCCLKAMLFTLWRTTTRIQAEDDEEDDVEEAPCPPDFGLVDMCGCDADAAAEDQMKLVRQPTTRSSYPLQNMVEVESIAFRAFDRRRAGKKDRQSEADKELLRWELAYGDLLTKRRGFSDADAAERNPALAGVQRREACQAALEVQRSRVKLSKLNQSQRQELSSPAEVVPMERDMNATSAIVPMQEAMRGPAACAWRLLQEAECTQEQIDAVALVALALEKQFRARPDSESPLLSIDAK